MPCFNEEEVLPLTAKRVGEKLDELIASGDISESSGVVFIDDGSSDSTWRIITELHAGNPSKFYGISLAHNSGEQNAYIAGLLEVKDRADVVITMDADLEDDIDAVNEMLEKWHEGNDIVYGVRSKRDGDTVMKRETAGIFYGIMTKLGTEFVPNHSQYRLMSRRALEAFSQYKESKTFLPALFPLLGFDHAIVYYKRNKRPAGKTKYNFWSLTLIALNGLTFCTTTPIRLISIFALLCVLAVFASIIAMIVSAVAGTVPTWLYVFTSLWAVGALELTAMRIIGEYVGATSMEVRKRPRYIIKENHFEDINGKDECFYPDN